MDERVVQFRVGVMVLATLIITAILLVLFGKLPNLTGGVYPVRVRFDNAGGISKGTPVRKSGLLIGRVGDVELTDDDRKVLATLEIQSSKTIYQDEEPFITRDLLGDTAVVFAPKSGKRIPHVPIDAKVVLPGRLSDDPTGLKRALQGPIDTVQETGEALTAASKKLGAAAQRVEDILNDDAQRDVRDILRDAAKSLKVVQKVLGDEANQTKLADALSKLPNTLDSMNHTFTTTDETLRLFTKRSGPDRKTAIERMVDTIEMTQRTLRKFSEAPESGQPAPADQIAAAMENIGEITKLMRSIMTRIDNGDGSLGKLLNDPELYNRINKAAKNIEQVSRELRPIVADAGVFMDKAARHPGVIVRDAVKPGVGIK
jgi:phospholipid/cholesterol/gamma-HCH transport system substrate-binding protein